MKSSGWTNLKATNFWQAAFVRPFPKSNVFWSPGLKALLAYAFGVFFYGVEQAHWLTTY